MHHFIHTDTAPSRAASADPGFPVGGGVNPQEEHQHTIFSKIPPNCMKLRNFWL